MWKLFIVFTLYLTGCVSKNKITYLDMALPDAIQPGYQVKDLISHEDLEFDKRVLIHNLQFGYGGRFNIDAKVLNNAKSEIKKIKGDISTLKLCEAIHSIFENIPDNHLKVYKQGQSCGIQEALKSNIGESLARKKNKIWIVENHKKENKNILYISIKNFPSHKDPIWDGFLDKVKTLHHKTDFVVLDLRGNGGGDDTIGYMLSAYFHKQKDHFKIPTPYLKQITSQTPETQILKINSAEVDLRFKTGPENIAQDWKLESEDLLNKVLKKDLEEIKVTMVDPIPNNWEFTGYKTPIYIIMDKGCGSSCESSIHAFEYNPYVTKVGQSTSGTLHFGNIAHLYLPNSLLLIQTPTHANFFSDGRFIEKIGIKPDLEVPDGTDAYDYLVHFPKHE